MRQIHRAGEKCFVDYCGPTVPIIDPTTGVIREAAVFVGVLGASSYTFAEATWSQSLPDWLGSHSRMFAFFGGCPELVIPDNLKSGVSRACRYDPEINPSYQQLAAHYQVAVLPARPYKPQDKAKAEVGVQVVERWILARLRRLSFFSLGELNQAIRSLLVELNAKPFKQLPGNRRQAFEQLDRPALRPLPRQPYQYTEIKPVKAGCNYHVQFKDHHYSVPHPYVGETLELHATEAQVRLYFRQRQIACHPRKRHPGYTTLAEHMPQRHQQHQAWTPQRLQGWAKDIGPETLAWISRELELRDHPEQAYKTCLGLMNLSREFSPARLEATCGLANQAGLRQHRQLRSILTSNRDQLPKQLAPQLSLPQDHENVRGPNDFH
jgi:hypothetical protein